MWNFIKRVWIPIFCASDGGSFLNLRFENDVKMYGIQTSLQGGLSGLGFENDVKMYGIQTAVKLKRFITMFENDVKMYGIQTKEALEMMFNGLRMM